MEPHARRLRPLVPELLLVPRAKRHLPGRHLRPAIPPRPRYRQGAASTPCWPLHPGGFHTARMGGAGLERAGDRFLSRSRSGDAGRLDHLPRLRRSARAPGGVVRVMDVVIVAAVGANGVIGSNNALPWRLKSDLTHFRALTLGKPVIMGRKTFLSLGRPLGGRTNIVLSRDPSFTHEAVLAARD